MTCGSSSKVRDSATATAHASASAQVGPSQNARPQQAPTIISAVAADPLLPPSEAAKQLFPKPAALKRGWMRFRIKNQLEEGRGKHWIWDKGAVHQSNLEPDDLELEQVRARFGYKPESEGGPSRLYLMILADCLLPLPRYPMSGVVSPPLLATTGIVPLSIISSGPDIIGHYYDCIVAARKEVILLTNYWQLGKNVEKIAEALRELNTRVEQRRRVKFLRARRAEKASEVNASPNRSPSPISASASDSDLLASSEAQNIQLGPPTPEERIVVKIMWDRGPQNLADLFRMRKPVLPSMWKPNGLPEEHEIPNLNAEIQNYHRPLMGTFHAKLLIVDRQVALINSNNVQDRPNIEACTRLEGDIVNSIYDHALISWGTRLNPPLPCLSTPAPVVPSPSAFSAGSKESTLPVLTVEKLRELSHNVRKTLQEEDAATEHEKERSMHSSLGRLHLSDVVDQVMRREGHHKSTPSLPGENADGDKAARTAGALWAQKVLGDRFSHGETSEHPDHPHSKRHFADTVEALMKKEGIKPGLWAEGALEAFGLGPSSSRNVANEVRRNPRPRGPIDLASKGLRIPTVVKEEVAKQLVNKNNASADVPNQIVVVDDVDSQHYSIEADSAADGAPSITMVDDQSSPTFTQTEFVGDEQKSDESQILTAKSENANLLPPTTEGGLKPPSIGDLQEMAKNDSDTTQGAPGSIACRKLHRRTLSTLSKSSAAERLSAITKSLDFANNSKVQGEIKAENLSDEALKAVDDVLDFQPYIFHQPHDPVPMALVNRRPHGTPGHSDIRNPQDAAWLAGFRYAKQHVFIQSPTLNATPIKAAVLACVRRQVRVELWLDLGFNDKSESMPFQGGTNEQVVTGLYRQLRREGKGNEKYLEVYWYTGKDMARPLNAVRKQRNCHVKFASFDGQVAILGSGNQDTQSWFHSQEINVMVDSQKIVEEWMQALRRNQSTHIYGKVDQKDGIWRGRSGAEIVDTGKDKSPSPR